MEIFFDPTEAVTFEVVPAGTYPMRIAAVDGPHQGPKAQYITVEFHFADGEVAAKAGSVWRNYPIEGKGTGFLLDLWKKAVGEEIGKEEGTNLDLDDLVGCEVTCEIGSETFEGTERNKLLKVLG